MCTVVREVMGGTVRNFVWRSWPLAAWRLVAVVGVGATLSACSADVTRLDYPALGLSDSSTGSTNSRPQPPQPVYTQPSYQQPAYTPPPANGYGNQGYGNQGYGTQGYSNQGYGSSGSGTQSYGAQDYGTQGSGTSGTGSDYGGYDQNGSGAGSSGYGNGGAQPLPNTRRPNRQSILNTRRPTDLARLTDPEETAGTSPGYGGIGSGGSAGDTITVRKGETLYGLSRRYGVPVAALMDANGLSQPNLKVGQKLIVPGGATRTVAYEDPLPAKPRKKAATRALPEEALAVGGDTYRVRSGDSLYGIAQRLKVDPQALADANGIDDPAKIKLGQVLNIPGSATAVADSGYETVKPARKQRIAALPPAAATDYGYDTAADAGPAVEEGSVEDGNDPLAASPAETPSARKARAASAAIEPEMSTAAAGGASDGKFRWPVKGRIIGKFGGTSDGQRNDGINVAVPPGTEVKAAEGGVVAYAGEELKGYGKLVLIRHADNWVSAYAHNSEILVRRGESVRRGQAIAKSGKTGTVEQPQLHFELRRGSEPVDPLPHMASN